MKSKRKVKKSIESLKKQRDLHKEKISKMKDEDKGNPVIAYWEKEVERFEKDIDEEEGKL